MARLQSIVNALEEINSAEFQELCDHLIYGIYRNRLGFSRVGSQSQKQKTVRGTPDSLIILENGNYGFVEATTDISNKGKLRRDIEACFDPIKVKIDTSKIEVVILCYNFEINIPQMDQLIATGKNLSQTVDIDFWSLDRLALELDRNFPNLVNRFLGLAFDTGQILPLDQFIREYQGAAQSIATPLDNEFVHREREQQELIKAMKDSDLVILTGAPGAGKTKLAVETIKTFCELNPSYTAFAISDKDAPLHEDLPQQLDSKIDNFLFVDDANRIETLGQIKGFFNRARDGKLKMLATVRDYALEETTLRFQPLLPLIIQVDRFSDTDIVDIIKGKPFEILNPDYQRIIINIADGNPRLAIMASLLAKEKQTLNSLNDVSDLFDRYFSTFLSDLEMLSTKMSLKCLGLVAFFHSMPKTRALLQPILDLFELDYYTFSEVVDALEKAELVQLKFDYIKIAEQNVGTFFFFKTFIQEELLSLEILFDNFYENNHGRFMDTIVPATNTFGYTRVTKKITPVIKNKLSTLPIDDPIYFSLLNDFWYPLKEDVLEYVLQFIEAMPVSPCKNIWELNFDNIRTDEIAPPLSLIRKFLANGVDFKTALELTLGYIEKNPNQIPHLLHILKDDLDIRRDDVRSGLEAQFLLLNKLISLVDEGNEIAELLLLEMSKLYLSFTSRYHEYNGRNDSVTIITLTIPNEDSVQRFREKLWRTLDSVWNSNNDAYFEVLNNYLQYEMHTNSELLLFDAEHIVKLYPVKATQNK
ncbi:MAG: hypothetical protein HQ556_11830 [Candidatus Marinimicrobia bacterium]|nr:hypothetical protein [Candidatus Neomarinimicrobiota bacterium]